MPTDEPYASPEAVIRAITDLARARAKTTGESTSALKQQAFYDRFLCRVLAGDSSFALKGGMGMIARYPGSRTTRDVDLERADSTIDAAVDDLVARAKIDLGDHLDFRYVRHVPTGLGGQQPDLSAAAVHFDIWAGRTSQGPLHVDVAIHHRPATEPEMWEPHFRLFMPRLKTIPFPILAIEDQIADKVSALRGTFGSDRPSSRTKDIADLALIALSGAPRAAELARAFQVEFSRRKLAPTETLDIPEGWEAKYAKIAKETSGLHDLPRIKDALAVARGMVEPVLRGEAVGTWDAAAQEWRA